MSFIYAQGGRLGTLQGGVSSPDEFELQGAYFTSQRPCLVTFRGDVYSIGNYTRPLVRHSREGGVWRLAGIKPPKYFLSVVPGAGTGGSSGFCLAAITFVHKAGGVVLAESDYGNVVNVGDLAGEGRAWSNIDAVTGEKRVTHVRGHVSMNGGLFRMAWELPYGTTTFTENKRTAQLTYAGPLWDHGVPPPTRYGHSWAGRMWYAHSPQHPYRLWRSMPGFPQYVKPSAFLDTLDREPITGLWKGRNELLVFCQRACYMARQFGGGADDFVLEKLDSDVGCVCHAGISEIHNRVWFPGEDGAWLYDGSFRFLGKELGTFWADDYQANKDAFENGWGVHDKANQVYWFVTRRESRPEFENSELAPGTLTYVGYYGAFDPSLAGEMSHPEWMIDMKWRFDSSGYYDLDGELLIGSCDGKIRKQDWSNGDDDGDRLRKEAIVRSGHQLFFEPGDDKESGKSLPQLWYYVESELTAWSVYVRGGEESAWRAKLPDNDRFFWKADIAASAVTQTRAIARRRSSPQTVTMQFVPETVHYFTPERVSGRGFTFEMRAIAPIRLEYRGFGGVWLPASGATRPTQEITTIEASLFIEPGVEMDFYDPPTVTPGSKTPSVELVYLFGSPAWPISCRLVCAALSYDETISLADPDLTGTFPAATLVAANTYTFTLTVLDGNGVALSEPYLATVVCGGP